MNKIELQNFRCFSSLSIDLHKQLTVLVAPNGGGKTSVLDAARIALWPFVKGFDLGSQTGKSATIQVTDVRRQWMEGGTMEGQVPAVIRATGEWERESTDEPPWEQFRESLRPGTNTRGDATTRAFTAYGKQLERQVRAGADVTLPLVSYLGTSRLWFEGRFSSEARDVVLDVSEFSRTSGYLNCLSYSSSFKAFAAWYGWVFRSYREIQSFMQEGRTLSPNDGRFETIIGVIKSAINALVQEPTGWRDLEYRASLGQQLVMQHDQLGLMPVEDLSDGLRNAISLVADLAFRACKLNPHLGVEAARQTPGVVLIDEVDMFLHPSWQQTILGSLMEAFQQIQFIVTTHSPQVLSSIDAACIRRLHEELDPETGQRNITVSKVNQQTRGVASSDLLAEIMGVDPIPNIHEARWVSDYHALIQQNLHPTNAGLALRAQLENHFGANHPVMRECERMIRLQTFKQRLPRRVAGEEQDAQA
ncbi:putative ATP-binding protein involved in virulence [Leptothrix sp. C29]|uniref:ATP-binding protein involved in virulence n=1 Tax=Sphaerotilus uruguayifluvii TaxID=2735897 RepID=A0ABX2GA22_9BURK|nr:putative ATP-binding protein involved in virulence [Leptothrix sp. C29]